jgi:IS5 family transposase
MEKQKSFSDIEFEGKKKTTRREHFLEKMEAMIPWQKWIGVIEGVYPKGERGRPPMGAEKMLRMYLLQIWFSLSDEVVEDSLYDIQSMRRFVGINLATESVPDATTLLKFRRLLEEHEIAKQLFEELKSELKKSGKMMKEGTIVDATIIEAPSSTKNKSKERDPEMHQTKKGNQWFFGMKVHIGTDVESGLIHSVEATPANVHDIDVAEKLLHGEEKIVYGDSGYTGLEKREEMKEKHPCVECRTARRPGKISRMEEGSEKEQLKAEEHAKSSVRAKVEHPFHIIKDRFKFRKVCYKGIQKNLYRIYMLLASANLIITGMVYPKQQLQGVVCQ